MPYRDFRIKTSLLLLVKLRRSQQDHLQNCLIPFRAQRLAARDRMGDQGFDDRVGKFGV